MKKFLRLSLVALFAIVFNVVSAEDILWSEDFSSYAANDVPTGGTYNYVCADNGKNLTKIYEANLATGTSPELLIGKSGGSFTATIPMNGKSGELTLNFLANKASLVVTATNGTVGEKSAAGNSYTYPITVEAGTESVTITFGNISKDNIRFDNVKLYQGVTLGALSVQKELMNKKRHPTIEDDVTIYSGATILGGETVIGKGCIIGGNTWITKSVPAGTTVIQKK